MSGYGPRPFGVGPYGDGAYSRWPVYIDCHAGCTLIFGAQAPVALTIRPWAASQIIWNAWVEEPALVNWMPAAPCEIGVWTPAAPCEPGGWATAAPCAMGSWQPQSLTTP